jgi:hypothetical protein
MQEKRLRKISLNELFKPHDAIMHPNLVSPLLELVTRLWHFEEV